MPVLIIMITVCAENYTHIPEISMLHIYTHTYLIASSNKGLQHKCYYDS